MANVPKVLRLLKLAGAAGGFTRTDGKGVYKMAALIAKHPKGTILPMAAYGGWNALGLTKKMQEEGSIGVLKTVIQAKKGEEQSIGEQVVDAVVGTDNVKKATDTVSKKVDEVGDAVKGVISPQTDGEYTVHPEAINTMTSDFPNIFGLLGSLFSGKGLGIGAMIAGAFMLFGRMGWLGKIAGLLTLGLGYKGITSYNESQRLQQQLASERERRDTTQKKTASEIYEENRENSNENIIINRQRS